MPEATVRAASRRAAVTTAKKKLDENLSPTAIASVGLAGDSMYDLASQQRDINPTTAINTMAKPHHKLKKANHGRRPANAKARKAKRKKIKT